MESDLNILILGSSSSASVEFARNMIGIDSDRFRTATHDAAIDKLAAMSPDLAVIDPTLRAGKHMRCIHKLKIIDPAMPVFIFADDSQDNAPINFPFEGIFYLGSDLDSDEILIRFEEGLRQMYESRSRPDCPVIIGNSQWVKGIRQKLRKLAEKDITVLITGETGTGKELIARSIHCYSERCKRPLIKVNCASLPEELLESEVFGFQKGAFTDAYQTKPGRIELAQGGTLFIDEIGDLSLSLQVKFQQVFEETEFSRLGGTDEKTIDIRVVAATNADLWGKVQEGSFRKDLYYRLNVVNITVPPLRERKEDIPLLAHYFQNKYCLEYKKGFVAVPDEVSGLFMEYHWPGNVRELENIIRRAIAMKDWGFVFEELNLEDAMQGNENDPSHNINMNIPDRNDDEIGGFFKDGDFSLKKISREYVYNVELKAIIRALQETQWNRTKAAQLLKVGYKTLLNRIDEFDLKP